MRCLCEWNSAILIAGRALEFYPGNPALLAELQSLEAQIGDLQPMDTTDTRH